MEAIAAGACEIHFNRKVSSVPGCGTDGRQPDMLAIYPDKTCDVCEIPSASQNPTDQQDKANDMHSRTGRGAGPLGGAILRFF